jgi:hypothetical protein
MGNLVFIVTCDICGKERDGSRGNCRGHVLNVEYRGNPTKWQLRTETFWGESEVLDICPECANELSFWLYQKMKKG